MLHGLSDAPYSLESVGRVLHERGFHVVWLRLPGHGTIPGALRDADWEDWMAATALALRHAADARPGSRCTSPAIRPGRRSRCCTCCGPWTTSR